MRAVFKTGIRRTGTILQSVKRTGFTRSALLSPVPKAGFTRGALFSTKGRNRWLTWCSTKY